MLYLVLRRAAAVLMTLAMPWAAAWAQPTDVLPAMVGESTKKQAVDLAQLRGKVALLFFWSTDCPVCMNKLPELRRNLAGWKGKDFVIVAVNQDRSMNDLMAYEQVLMKAAPGDAQLEKQMPILWRKHPAHRDNFGELPTRMPTTIIVGRDGKIVKTIRGRVPNEVWDDIAELVLN